MKIASLAVVLVAALSATVAVTSDALAGPPPPPSIKLPTMEDPPPPASKPRPSAPRQQRAQGSQPGASSASQAHVVLYGTTTCGFCARARAYMNERGIPFQDLYIDRSEAADAQYSRYGVNGVPLFVIGDEVLQGFVPAKLDAAIARAQQR